MFIFQQIFAAQNSRRIPGGGHPAIIHLSWIYSNLFGRDQGV